MKQILVLGGGAAGMAAAITAAQAAGKCAHVVLVEANPKLGKKLLATGNGRCNLANADIRPAWYFTSDEKRMAAMLESIRQKADPVQWFVQHGLFCREPDEAGRIYPYSNQAADVAALLQHWLEAVGVEILYESRVADLWMQGGRYQVKLEDSRTLSGQAVICALGGSAGPQFGTDGFGGRLSHLLGLQTQPEYPCLVPLYCEKAQVKGLAGIRVKGDVTLYAGNKPLRVETGEVQFTDYGISGIAVMQLSGLLRPGCNKDFSIGMNVFPQMETARLAEMLGQRAAWLPGVTMTDYMTGLIHRKVGLAIYHRCSLGAENRPAASLSQAEWYQLARGFQDWRFTGLTPTGWKNAQTTGGGLALAQLETDTFGLKSCPGLYFVGEMVDCAGSCGGFNLYWAFGSGILAGRAAADLLLVDQPVRSSHSKSSNPKKQKRK